jgi:hypothetical protein
MLHGRERFGHHDMDGDSLKTTGQRKSLPMIPYETVANMRDGCEDLNRAIAWYAARNLEAPIRWKSHIWGKSARLKAP